MFRLDVPGLLEIAKACGDDTQAKISRRTGIAESSVSRYLRGEAQPDLNCAMRLSEAYDFDLRSKIKREPIKVTT